MTGEQTEQTEQTEQADLVGRTRPGSEAARSNETRHAAVLLGGPSAEHDVSVVSGWAIADALAGAGLTVERVYIDLLDGWWSMPADAAKGRPKPGVFDDPAAVGGTGPRTPAAALQELAARSPQPILFPALHGPFGEDGTIQALFEAYQLPYAGAGVAASAVGMDKALFKRLVGGMGMPVVEWEEVTAARWSQDRAGVLDEIEASCRRVGEVRVMVKPARLGSSVGLTIAHTPGERGAALDEAFRYDTLAVVERYLEHPRELEVAVVGNDPDALEAFGPGEIMPGREFYDYVAKYSDGVSEFTASADIPEALGRQVREIALDAYRAVGCEGFARLDFLYSGGKLYLSEINTIPGFTQLSLFPLMAATGHGSFGSVCLKIVDLAEQRHTGRVRRRLTPADLPR